jgi:hypothetical protein
VSLRPGSLAFNPRPRCLSTPPDAFELHPDVRLYGTTLRHARGSKSGHVLSDGRLSFKVTKTYQADLVGLSKVSVGEPTECGRVRLDCVETF